MTLHEAIEKVINQFHQPLSAQEIADEINKQKLYIRGDGNPVPSSQIHARVKNYPQIFNKKDGKIWLVKLTAIDFKNYRSKKIKLLPELLNDLTIGLYNKFNLSDFESILIVSGFTVVIKEIKAEFDNDGFIKPIANEELEDTLKRLINENHQLKDQFNYILTKIDLFSNVFFKNSSQGIHYQVSICRDNEFNEYMIEYFSRIGFFSKTSFFKNFYTPDYINKILVNLSDPKDEDIIYDPAAGIGKTLVGALQKNNNVFLVGVEKDQQLQLLSKVYTYLYNCRNIKLLNNNSLENPSLKKNSADVIISNPPFNEKLKDLSKLDFERLSNDRKSEVVFFEMMLSRLNPITGRMAVVVPDGFLFSKSNFPIRKHLIESDLLDTVIGLPKGSYYPATGVNTSIVFINQHKKQDRANNVLFIDCRTNFEFKIKDNELSYDKDRLTELVDSINHIWHEGIDQNKSLKSKIIHNSQISELEYVLIPERYSSGILQSIEEIEKTENLVELKDFLSSAYSIPSSKYDYGEKMKFVQIRDLNENPSDFYLRTSTLNESKEIKKDYRIVANSALLVARIGNNLKPTYCKANEPIALSSSIVPFKVDTKKVNIEFLISQLDSEFFSSQFHLIQVGAAMKTFQINAFLKLKIPIPPLIEQLNKLAIYKEKQANKLKMTNFIRSIKLANTPEEIKAEIERYAGEIFKDSKYIVFNRDYEFEKFPFSEKDIIETQYIKNPKPGGEVPFAQLLLIDDEKRTYGVLTVHTENNVSFEQYSEINAYANFVVKTSTKFLRENTNKLLKTFNHSTKNMLKDINKILKDFINTKNEKFLEALNTSYLKDDELIDDLIKRGGRKREDFLAINRISEAHRVVNKHFEQLKRRHSYYSHSINSGIEEIKLTEFINKIFVDQNYIGIDNQTNDETILAIKAVPIEMAFNDILDNAKYYSPDEFVEVKIQEKLMYVDFLISNSVKDFMSKENYEILGKEDLKNGDGTNSTGLCNAFQFINEDNEISLIPYKEYSDNRKFTVKIKLKKK